MPLTTVGRTSFNVIIIIIVIGQQSVPNVASLVKGAIVMVIRDRTLKMIVSRWQKPRAWVAKAKSAGTLDDSDKKTLQLADLFWVSLETNVMTGSGTMVVR